MKAYAIFLACEAAAVLFFFPVTVKISMIFGNKRLHVHLCIATLHFLPSIVSHTCLNGVDISLDLIHTTTEMCCSETLLPNDPTGDPL